MIIAYTCFLVLVLEYFELLWLLVVPQFLEVNKDLEGRWAHDGLRVMWLAGGRPGFWSPVFGLPGQCSLHSLLRLPLLPQPPLRLRVKRCFSDNSSVLLCHLLPTEFFFFYSCRCYKYFKTTNIEYDWRVVESVTWECAFLTQRVFLADFILFFFLDIDTGETVKTDQKLPFCEGHLHWWRKFPFVKVSSSQYQKEKDVSKSQKNLVNGEYLNLCNKPSHFNFSCFSY